MPYRSSSPESLAHAELVTRQLGIPSRTVDITAGVDGIVGAIVLVFLVLLITDIVGLTKVFPFTRSMR